MASELPRPQMDVLLLQAQRVSGRLGRGFADLGARGGYGLWRGLRAITLVSGRLIAGLARLVATGVTLLVRGLLGLDRSDPSVIARGRLKLVMVAFCAVFVAIAVQLAHLALAIVVT